MSNATVTTASSPEDWIDQIRDHLTEAVMLAERYRPSSALAARCQELLDSLEEQFR